MGGWSGLGWVVGVGWGRMGWGGWGGGRVSWVGEGRVGG